MCFFVFGTQQGFNKWKLDIFLVRFRASILHDLEAKALYRGMMDMKSQKILLYFESEPLSTLKTADNFFAFRIASPCSILYPSARADAHGGGNKRTAGALPT
jgi:hypothetical protein